MVKRLFAVMVVVAIALVLGGPVSAQVPDAGTSPQVISACDVTIDVSAGSGFSIKGVGSCSYWAPCDEDYACVYHPNVVWPDGDGKGSWWCEPPTAIEGFVKCPDDPGRFCAYSNSTIQQYLP